MDVQITPVSISRLAPTAKYKPGTPAFYQQNRFSSFKTGNDIGQGSVKQNVLITRSGSVNTPQTLSSTKPSGANNNLLLISRTVSGKPRVFLKVTPNLHQNIQQAPPIPGNKKVMLYQQIERNKLFSNNSELVNRFNYKV